LGAFGDGGAVISGNANYIKKARKIAQHGQSSKYVHDIVGMNSRLDTLQAAVLSVKLPYLDNWTKKRQEIATIYKRAFASCDSITLGEDPTCSSHVYHQFTMLIRGNRNKIMEELQKVGIPVRLYYPNAIHQQKAFSHLPNISLKHTEYVQSQMISLPIHPTLSTDQVQYIVNTVISVLKNQN
jgi:dTDP-4-amino-4,6-dideoxygalactose transaminase